jgi:hypothetical protein
MANHQRITLLKRQELEGTYNECFLVGCYSDYCRINNQRCEINPSTIGNLFNMGLSIEYPPEFSTIQCRENFIAKVQSYIANQHPNISLTVPFSNTQTLTIQLTLCSFSSLSTGK